MPCRSDYMEPNAAEIASKEVCNHLVYVLSALHQVVPQSVARGSTAYYGDVSNADSNAALLCDTIQKMTKVEQDTIVYNGRDEHARRVASWWEQHQNADIKREKAEAAAAVKQQLREAAMAKLSPAELEALKD